MADNDDDDEFGLDDSLLDDIPDNALEQLERDAFQATQQQRQSTANKPPPMPKYQARQAWHQQNQESYGSDRTLQPNRLPSDYGGFDDEDIIDLDEQPYSVQQEYNQGSNHGRLSGQEAKIEQNEMVEDSFMTAVEQPSVNVAELQERILKLENDRINLERAVEEARAVAQSKAGEAAILRQKTEKAARDYEQKVSTLRQLHAEEHAKQKAELERVRNEREKVVTNNKFLEHDLALEAGRVRQVQKKPGLGERVKNGDVTPKKNRVLPFRDGFDDDDLVMLSPSKTKSRPSTPKAGAKRKRNANENSPMPPPPLPLPLSEPKLAPITPRPVVDAKVSSHLLLSLANDESKLRFMQNILSQPVNAKGENVFEALRTYGFPSEQKDPSVPKKRISTIIFERLTSQPFVYQIVDIPTHFCDILLSIWEQCLEEKHYHPLTVLIKTVQSILDSESLAFSTSMIDKLVPIAIATSDVVAIPTARSSINKSQPPEDNFSDLINVVACLTILRTLAQAAAPFIEAKTKFWQQMKFDFVLLMLMKAQPLQQVQAMLQLLQTSALESTFGAILSADEGGEDRQARREVDMIDRLTLLFFETPKPEHTDEEDQAKNPTSVLDMRIEVLAVLEAMCIPDHGGRALTTHQHAIPRLFKFLHFSINSLYQSNPSLPDHAKTIHCINTCMKLIYYLITSFGRIEDVRAKMGSVQGGNSMMMIALTRVAFCERVYVEEGIWERSCDMAHQLLDEWLSPDEGEALLQMFSSGGSEG